MTRNEAKLTLLRSRIQDINDDDFEQAFDMAIQALSIPEHTYENCRNLTCRRKCETDGYYKAIDDFIVKYKFCDNRSIQCKKALNCADCIAEQLKGGE